MESLKKQARYNIYIWPFKTKKQAVKNIKSSERAKSKAWMIFFDLRVQQDRNAVGKINRKKQQKERRTYLVANKQQGRQSETYLEIWT